MTPSCVCLAWEALCQGHLYAVPMSLITWLFPNRHGFVLINTPQRNAASAASTCVCASLFASGQSPEVKLLFVLLVKMSPRKGASI